MSNSNKTTIPGMGNNPFEVSTPSPVTPQPPQGVYSGTCFPGMDQRIRTAPNNASDTHKPIMGFLFSVSRTSSGEYWPIYLGQNTIGRATNCSIRLQEGTISENHAELVIRNMKNPDRILAFVKDSGSTCGVMLNDSSLGFEPQECKNGDIITIGENYQLYVVLIDVAALGLAPLPGFASTSNAPAVNNPFGAPMHDAPMSSPFQQSPMSTMPGTPMGFPQGGFAQPQSGFPQPQGGFPQPQGGQASQGTVMMDALKR